MVGTETYYSGGCFCGAVRYEINGELTYAGNCHCRDCQHAIGAAYVTWIGAKPEDFAVTKGEVTHCETSPGIQRGFCGRCGTSLTFGGEGWDELGITASSLDDPGAITPESNVFLDHRQPWAPYDESLRNYPRFP